MSIGGERRQTRVKDGHEWRLGRDTDIAWIRDHTPPSLAITAAVPPVFDAYATIELPTGDEPDDDHAPRDQALVTLLKSHSADHRWWLGYLDTGADDLVFPDAPMVTLYSGWSYVLVEAGPHEAVTWRTEKDIAYWKGTLPNLMFPTDHSWLVSTLWDDDWTCVGGTSALVGELLDDPVLGPRTRRIDDLHMDATPPGHCAR